jgi:hypothetical protein
MTVAQDGPASRWLACKGGPCDDRGDLSVEALPYTALLLLAQLTAGMAIAVLFVQLRGGYALAFIRTCTWMTLGCGLMLVLLVASVKAQNNAGSYALDPDVLNPAKAVGLAMFLFTFVHMYFLRNEDETFLQNAIGATIAGLGCVMLVLLANMVRLPTWGFFGPALTLFAGALTLGVFTVAMIWGHWYLVKPDLAEGPLVILCALALAATGLELLTTAINAIVPVGYPVQSDALLAIDLPSNPAFWLRIGIGIVFPAALAYMAYVSSKERAMMSATGLLYIAVGALLAGEALGRGLLFVTGAAV